MLSQSLLLQRLLSAHRSACARSCAESGPALPPECISRRRIGTAYVSEAAELSASASSRASRERREHLFRNPLRTAARERHERPRRRGARDHDAVTEQLGLAHARCALPRVDPGLGDDRLAERDLAEVVELVAAHDPHVAELAIAVEVPAARGRVRRRCLEHPAQVDEVRHVAEVVDVGHGGGDRKPEALGHGGICTC
jgi:hypothetical protein